MSMDKKARRKELRAQLRALSPDDRTEDILSLLDERCNGGKRRPGRICKDLLPYRYSAQRHTALGKGCCLHLRAHQLGSLSIEGRRADSGQRPAVLGGVQGHQANSDQTPNISNWRRRKRRKRGNSGIGPAPKRHQVMVLGDDDADRTRESSPARDSEPSSQSDADELAVTAAHAEEHEEEGLARHNPDQVSLEPGETNGNRPSSQIDAEVSHAGQTRSREARIMNPAPSREEAEPLAVSEATPSSSDTGKRLLAVALSRCHVAVFPLQLFSDLIANARRDVEFARRGSEADGLRSRPIGADAARFCIQISHRVLEGAGARPFRYAAQAHCGYSH
ncbi:hypothetical protein ACJZ2D_008728 [Fusarium nematophilum]